MKKRFVLVMALILLVASASVFADVKITGSFRAGYKFVWNNDNKLAVTAVKRATGAESRTYMNVADKDGIWSINFSGALVLNNSDIINLSPATLTGTRSAATISLDKALKTANVDLKDVTVDLSIGNTTHTAALWAYSDPLGNEYYLENTGVYSTALTVGYAKMVKVRFGFDPSVGVAAASDKEFRMVLSALVTPVDGVSVAGGFANRAYDEQKSTDYKTGLDASVNADIAKLAQLDKDVKVGASAHLRYYAKDTSDNDVKLTFLDGALTGGYKTISGYVEYRGSFDGVNSDNNKNGMQVKATYSGIKNASLYASYDLNNFKSTDHVSKITVGATYTLAGIKFCGEPYFQLTKASGADDVKAFGITTYAQIGF